MKTIFFDTTKSVWGSKNRCTNAMPRFKITQRLVLLGEGSTSIMSQTHDNSRKVILFTPCNTAKQYRAVSILVRKKTFHWLSSVCYLRSILPFSKTSVAGTNTQARLWTFFFIVTVGRGSQPMSRTLRLRSHSNYISKNFKRSLEICSSGINHHKAPNKTFKRGKSPLVKIHWAVCFQFPG